MPGRAIAAERADEVPVPSSGSRVAERARPAAVVPEAVGARVGVGIMG